MKKRLEGVEATDVTKLRPKLLSKILQERFSPPAILVDAGLVLYETFGPVEQYFGGIHPPPHRKITDCLCAEDAEALSAMVQQAFDLGYLVGVFQDADVRVEKIDRLGQDFALITFPFGKCGVGQSPKDALAQSLHDGKTGTGYVVVGSNLEILSFSPSVRQFLPLNYSDLGRDIQKIRSPWLTQDLLNLINQPKEEAKEAQLVIKDAAGVIEVSFRPSGLGRDGKPMYFLTFKDVGRIHALEAELKSLVSAQAELVRDSALIIHSDDALPVCQNICDFLLTALGAERVGLLKLQKRGQYAHLIAGAGWPRGLVGKTRIPLGDGSEFDAAIAKGGVLKITPDIVSQYELSILATDFEAQSILLVGIGRAGRQIGVLFAHFSRPDLITETARSLCSAMANVADLAERNAERAQEKSFLLRHQADLIDSLPYQIGILDEEFRFTRMNSQFDRLGWTLFDDEAVPVAEVFGKHGEMLLRDAFEDPSISVAMVEAEIDIPTEDDQVFLIHCVRRSDGQPGYYLSALNIDERIRSEELNLAVSSELDHRVKNILALVSSIAFLTGQTAKTSDDFIDAFEKRLDMLSRTHSLLAGQGWRGSNLKAVIAAELSPFESKKKEHVRLTGEHVGLGSKSTQLIAMIVHELVTNAVKYGALSEAGGNLNVSWKSVENQLELHWVETKCQRSVPVSKDGTGSSILKAVVRRQFKGDIVRELTDSGISYIFRIPKLNLKA